MQTYVSKWGASCAVRLPKMVVETLGLHEGQAVDMIIKDNSLVLKKTLPTYTLKKLVAQMDECTHPELIFDDNPCGIEIL